MIWDWLKGEFVDVIEWTDDSRDTLVHRFERRGHAIKYGAKLTVREGQTAVFVHEGRLADVFGPGLYELHTNNMPVMTTLQSWPHGFESPFKAEVYFVSTRRFQDLKWGTRNPITLRDPEFGPVRLRAFGTYAIRVADPAVFLREIVGTDGSVTTDEVEDAIRNAIVARVSNALAGSGIPVLDLAANTDRLADILRERIAPEIAGYGLETTALTIENVSLPEAVSEALDRRSSMGVIGDLDAYARFQSAEAMRAAAENPGSGGAMGAGLGAGMGLAMAERHARQAGTGRDAPSPPTATGAAPPPPPPPDPAWHLAEGGQSFGPYTRADLERMRAEGRLTRETPVWTAGMKGWVRAGEVAALASLFAAAPPPPPPG